MKWNKLYNSVFAIIEIKDEKGKIVGTGFVINSNPIRVLTCYHVVSKGTENNEGAIVYSISKRSKDYINSIDFREGEISFLKAKKITFKPEFDLAILEIDPNEHMEIAQKLQLNSVKSLKCSTSEKDRHVGSEVQWLTPGIFGDLSLNPRFFGGKIVSKYITNHNFEYLDPQDKKQSKTLEGIRFLEIDQLFIPGCSGGPIVNKKNGKLIGYVHGFNSWPIITNSIIQQEFEDTSGTKETIKYNAPLLTSLSLGIDFIEIYKKLRSEFLKK